MSRIRSVKPELFLDGKLAQVSIQARYVYVGLFTESDDEGRMLASTKRIAGSLFPHDDDIGAKEVAVWLAELERLGRIVRYADAETQYFYLPNFHRHQKISHPTPSRLPAPPEEVLRAAGEAPESLPPDLELGTGNREQGTRSTTTLALPRFADFYEIFPRHVGRRRAEQAFQTAVKRVTKAGGDPSIILDGARRYAADPNREDEFTAHPSTWLNRDGWEDESEPVRGNGHRRVDRAAQIAAEARGALP